MVAAAMVTALIRINLSGENPQLSAGNSDRGHGFFLGFPGTLVETGNGGRSERTETRNRITDRMFTLQERREMAKRHVEFGRQLIARQRE